MPEVELAVMMCEAIDKCRLLQPFQVVFGGEVAEDFLAPTLERVGGSL